LDYAVNREAISSIYIYIQGGVGEGQVHIIPHRQQQIGKVAQKVDRARQAFKTPSLGVFK
jgi:hypothetical protein